MFALFRLQFRYATRLDYLLILFGTITGIIHGVSLPLLMLVFGELINVFIYQEQSTSTASCLNLTRSCDEVFFSESEFLLPCGLNSTPFNGATLSQGVEAIFGTTSRCISDEQFEREITLYCVYFVIIAVAVFVFAYVEISFFQMACERQVRKIRLFFYRAVLKQSIGWFDSNPSGELASRLNE